MFRDNGFDAVFCEVCKAPLTDRHPELPGAWVAPNCERGPYCPVPGEGGQDAGEYNALRAGRAHQPVRA